MNVEILEASDKTYPNTGRYFSVAARCGKHTAFVVVYHGQAMGPIRLPSYVRVCVNNASNRAWRGAGKSYRDEAAALENFKTPEVRAIIQAVCKAAQEVH